MASKTLLALTAKLTADTSKFKQGLDKGKKDVNSFSKSIKKVGGLIAGAFAVSVLKNFAQESVRLYDVQEKAESGLLTALKGRYDIQQDIIRQAQEMQRKTLYGDEQSIEAAGRLAQVLGTNKQAIQDLLPLVADFATAKKMDMAQAAELIAKTVGSSTNALSRYGVVVEGAVGSSERLESATDALNQMVGGQAEAAAETGAASGQQLANSWGDVKEEFGELITLITDKMTPALDNLTTATAGALGGINDIIKDDQIPGWKKLLGMLGGTAGQMELLAEVNVNKAKKELEAKKAGEEHNEIIEEQIPLLQQLSEKIKEASDKRDNAITPEQLAKYQTYLDKLKEEKKFYESLREGDLNRTPAPDKLESTQLTTISVEDEGFDERIEKLTKINELQDMYAEKVAKSSEESIMWSEAVNSAMTNAINSVSYALANMMANLAVAFTDSEVSFKDMISGMLSALRDVLVGLLAQAIAGMLAQEVSKEGVYGLAVAAAGIGGLLALWESYVPDFAEGGVVYGETIARVAEYPGATNNPEVIAPLSKLKGMLNNSGSGNVRFEIEGEKLIGILNKMNKKNSLV
ncbi:MAG: hypothetical protein ACQESQ_08875 [Bacteroidota bacterium]